jgi:outer membrane protein, multidrug efflux system
MNTFKCVLIRLPLTLGLLILTFTGCATVGPDYIRPEVPVYDNWHTPLERPRTTEESEPAALARWWTTLRDTELSSLIQRAASGNLDLKKAEARIREARAWRGVAQAGLYPTIDATGRYSRDQTSASYGVGATTDLYAAGFDASWEIDLFGGIRRSIEAADANLQASREDYLNVLVSLCAEVATNYVDVRTYQVRLAVAEDNLKSQTETSQLTEWRYEAGLSDELAVQQARYNLENTRSQIPVLRSGLDAAMNRIAVLLGEQPGAIHAELQKPEPVPSPPLEIATGIPADLLRRRPDIKKAERDLAAQTARVGVATAELYPKFTLSGSIGIESLSTSSLFTSGSGFYSFGPSLRLPIFDGGSIRQNIEIQSALQEQALIQYESTILAALEEVENALVAYIEVQKRRHSLSEAVNAARQAADLAQQKYEAGLTDFTTVLDAQRSLLSFEEQLALSNGNVTSNLIRLYKALGGGWSSTEKES